MDKIAISGIRVMGTHGVLESEKKLGQPFEVDLEMVVDLTDAGVSDDLSKTINYALIYAIVEDEIGNRCYDLIEKLCYRIVQRILAFDQRIEKAQVTVKKPNAPIYGHFDHASVTIRRGRNEIDLSELRE